MEAQRSDLRGRMSKLDKKLAYKAKKSSTISDPSDFKVGDSVFVTTLSLNGTVKEAANKDGDLIIQMGFLSSVVNSNNLELLAPEKAPKPKTATALIKRQPSIQKLTFSEILLTRPSPASKNTLMML